MQEGRRRKGANQALALAVGLAFIGLDGSHVSSVCVPNRFLGGLLRAEVIWTFRPEPLLFDHFLPAAAARIQISTLPRRGGLCHRHLATALRVGTSVNFTLFESHCLYLLPLLDDALYLNIGLQHFS